MLAPILVGASVNAERTIQFYWRQETPDSVEGTVLNAEGNLIADAVPMVWPETAPWPGRGFLSVASRVQLLLRSCHLRPVYEADGPEIVFQRESSNGRQWEKWQWLELPQRTSAYLFRLSGRVSYACVGTVFTWDPVEGRIVKTRGYPTMRVTALAEMRKGALMVGDGEGRVHYRGRAVQLSGEGAVEHMWPLSEERCLVQIEGALIVLDCALGKEVQRLEPPFKVFVTVFGSFMWQGRRDGDVKEYQWKEGRYQCSWEKRDAQIEPLAAGNVVVFEGEKGITVFNSREAQVLFRNTTMASSTWEMMACIDQQLVYQEKNTVIKTYMAEQKLVAKKATLLGEEITDLTVLSNGELACITQGANASLCVLSQNHKTQHKCDKLEQWTRAHEQVEKVVELPDGSLALKGATSIVFLRYAIASQEPQALETAIYASRFYEARRLYEKARCEKKDKLFLQMVLSWLHLSTDKKLRRQIYADLFLETNQLEGFPLERECKRRLFVGEKNFSYTQTLITVHERTHPQLAKAITATASGPPLSHIDDKIARLQKSGVTILFSIDPHRLHEVFRGKRFERIHWNYPMDSCADFFVSCQRLQLPGDCIYVTLEQQVGLKKYSQQGGKLYDAALAAGYRLIRKRLFGSARYPGYQPFAAQRGSYSEVDAREFVFERAGVDDRVRPYEPDPMKKWYTVADESGAGYYECSTDEDSSDYYVSDETSS